MKHETIKTFFEKNLLALSVQLVGLIVVFINLWLTTKLAPMAQDVALVRQRVEALEQVESNRISKEDTYAIFNTAMDEIKNIGNKVDYLYQIHMK
jgi:galactitol-specific phosphotransferase system IIC component